MRTRWAAGGMVAALALATLAMAQDTGKPVESGAPSSGEGFFESIDVNVVNVDVYVTDKKGNRIKGLKKEDFELFEDRKPVAITNFYVVEEGEPQLEAVAPSEIPVARPGLPTEIPEDQRLHLVVYIDNANIRPFNRNRVFNSLRQFLSNNLTSEDRVMLMTYDREPHVRRSFTRDPNVVASALHEIEKINAMGLQADSDRREVLDEIERSNDYNYAASRAASYADSARNDLQFALDSLKETVSSLSGLPGRKAILYVSDGLPMIVGQDVFQAVAEKFSSTSSSALMESLRYDESRRFIELAAQATPVASRSTPSMPPGCGCRARSRPRIATPTPAASSSRPT
ncbi:MAG: VWA domain-containing protein [Thermoanaerobaculia bacterium]